MHQNKFILIKILNGQNLEEVTNVNIQNRLFKKFIPNIFCGQNDFTIDPSALQTTFSDFDKGKRTPTAIKTIDRIFVSLFH